MDIASLVQDHVYLAIVAGSLLEGETTVVLAGYAAHQGYAAWWAVTLVAASINFVWDQSYFVLGRWRGNWLLSRIPRLRPGVERVMPMLQRHRRWLVFGVRFLYGLRTAGPLALGMAGVSWREFAPFNALGATVWAVTCVSLGYLFGRSVAAIVEEASRHEPQAAALLIVLGAVWFAVRRLCSGRASRP